MKGLIRLDISSRIGTGHFQRMLNLADVLPDIDFTFLIKTDNPQNIIFKNHKVHFIGEDSLEALAAHAKDAHFIILDLLHYKRNFIKQVKEITGKLTITFHEYNDYSSASDLAINYNFFSGFEGKESSSFLAGPRYIIFNATLLNTRASIGEGVFVSFGGADPSGFTVRFINEIANQLTEIPFHIHIGPFFGHRKHLANIHIGDNVILHDQPSDLYDLMARSSMAVTAAGNMLYEFIYLQKRCFVLAHNAHQTEFATIAARHKACEYAGDKKTIDWVSVRSKLANAYTAPAIVPAYHIDGMGKYRIAKKISQILN